MLLPARLNSVAWRSSSMCYVLMCCCRPAAAAGGACIGRAAGRAWLAALLAGGVRLAACAASRSRLPVPAAC